jgi:acetyltransferase-like isoleucine patch superfamily enzyme
MKNNQLRKHLKFDNIHKKRLAHHKKILGNCGDDVFFDENIEIMRFPKNVFIGDNVIIKEGAKICTCNETAKIHIGNNTTIGYHTFIFASDSISIGNDCLVAPFVYIVDSDHGIEKKSLINEQSNISMPVDIKSDVWLATGAKILKGVTIGQGGIVAAGSVLSTDVEPYQIFGGIPAKKISERK